MNSSPIVLFTFTDRKVEKTVFTWITFGINDIRFTTAYPIFITCITIWAMHITITSFKTKHFTSNFIGRTVLLDSLEYISFAYLDRLGSYKSQYCMCHICSPWNWPYNYIYHCHHKNYHLNHVHYNRKLWKKKISSSFIKVELMHWLPSHNGKLKKPMLHWSHLTFMKFGLQLHTPLPSHITPDEPSALQLQALK